MYVYIYIYEYIYIYIYIYMQMELSLRSRSMDESQRDAFREPAHGGAVRDSFFITRKPRDV